MDREEFFRLKKVQGKKKKDTAAREEEDQKRRDAEDGREAGGAADLGIDKDEDGEHKERGVFQSVWFRGLTGCVTCSGVLRRSLCNLLCNPSRIRSPASSAS